MLRMNKMKYKNVIWDFDGTLFDSYPAMVESFHLALKEFNIDENLELIESLMKISVSTATDYIIKKYNCSSFISRFNEIRKNIENDKCVPYPDTYKTCEAIVKQGGKNFIFTHRGLSTIELLRKYNLDTFFTECITKENGFDRKPSPDGIEYLVTKYKLDQSETIMVGDRELDILSGFNAGINTCFYNNENKPPISIATLTITNLFDITLVDTICLIQQ